MTTRILLLLGFSFITLRAAESSSEDLLRQGLFEEEANHDLIKATAAYQAVIAAHDRQRANAASAATATFRLGEIARKRNDKDAAAAAFRAVVERFPEQAELARLSRENLAALGMAPAGEASAAVLLEEAEITRLKEIVRRSPDLIDKADNDGWRPLHHAASKGWNRVISYLLENRADPNSHTVKEQLTPLHLASIQGDLASVNSLLAAKADTKATFDIERCSEDVFPLADRKVKDPKGKWTALDIAILCNRIEIGNTLRDSEADKRTVNKRGVDTVIYTNMYDSYKLHEETNPLYAAIYLRRNGLAQALIDGKYFLIQWNSSYTPLCLAISFNPEMAVPLLKAGADPKKPYDAEGATPLHCAASHNLTEIAKLLIEAGADVNAEEIRGTTPLHLASSSEMVNLLVSKGANINAKTTSGLTPLEVIVGARTFVPSGIDALVELGATVDDPIALLNRCSTNAAVARVVCERIVYPREKRRDAILVAFTGSNMIHPPSPPAGNLQRDRSFFPDMFPLEIRPSPASPPPTFAEALREAFSEERQGTIVLSLRILRRSARDTFDTVREWKHTEGASILTGWPALQWGDIIEIEIGPFSGNIPNAYIPYSSELNDMITSPNIAFSLCGLEIPVGRPTWGGAWLGPNSFLQKYLHGKMPNLNLLADFSYLAIRRKGTAEPIKLDFTHPPLTYFRLIDGDIIELSLNPTVLNRRYGNADNYKVLSLFGGHKDENYENMTFPGILARMPYINFQKILVLRRTENWKSEFVDVKAWLESLPPSDQWEKDALQSSVPKFNAGDLVILVMESSETAKKAIPEIRKKLEKIDKIMSDGSPAKSKQR